MLAPAVVAAQRRKVARYQELLRCVVMRAAARTTAMSRVSAAEAASRAAFSRAAALLHSGPGGICRHCFRNDRQMKNSGMMPGILGIYWRFWAYFGILGRFLGTRGVSLAFSDILPARVWVISR